MRMRVEFLCRTFLHGRLAFGNVAKKLAFKFTVLFGHVEQSRGVWANLPPAFVYRCGK